MPANTKTIELLRALAFQAQGSEIYRKALRDVVETGMVLARQIQEQAKAPDLTPERHAELTAQFERIARSIRQTVRFSNKLAADGQTDHVASAEEQRAFARLSLMRSLDQGPRRKKKPT